MSGVLGSFVVFLIGTLLFLYAYDLMHWIPLLMLGAFWGSAVLLWLVWRIVGNWRL